MIALTRRIGKSITHNSHQLSHKINYELASLQHIEYENNLRSLDIKVHSLPALDDFPDSVFVGDNAIVFKECAIVTRPSDISRRDEITYMYEPLSKYRKILEITAPAILDGSDVLQIDKNIYVGLSENSNYQAIDQLDNFMNLYGYSIKYVPLKINVHLKSVVSYIGFNTILINSDCVDKSNFPGYKFIETDPEEPYAANTVLINDTVILPQHYPKTSLLLEENGFKVSYIVCDELVKIRTDGIISDCSLIFHHE